MTTTATRRITAALAVSTLLAIGQMAAAEETNGAPLGVAQPAMKETSQGRRRRIGRAAAIGAGVGAGIGFFHGANWCHNEGGNCSGLMTGFAGLGALAGAGIGAAIGAIGGK